jgi:predicted O-methyltransferase YrrM
MNLINPRKILIASSVAAILALALGVLAQPPGEAPRGRSGRPAGPFGPMGLPVMTAVDSDNDGELSAAEIAAASQALTKLDKDGDGKLDREELRPQFGGRGGPGGRGPGGPGGPGRGPGAGSASFENEPLAKDDGERKILQGIEDILQNQGRRMNVPMPDGRLLRVLAETVGAKKVVEFGTSNGISAIWMSLALRESGGTLITHEIDPDAAARARENFAAVGVADIVTVVEGDGHEKAADLKGPIDLVFIDADKEGYLDYYRKTLPLVRPGGLICAHNMNPRMASRDFVKAITTDPDVETVFYMEGAGMSVTLKKR